MNLERIYARGNTEPYKKYLIKFTYLLSAIILMSSCQVNKSYLSPKKQHLFILSGQSNMARLIPEESFTPTVAERFGEDRVLIAKNAVGGKSINRWYKDWHSPEGKKEGAHPDLYRDLMHEVKPLLKDYRIKTVTFVWMQGERDARQEWADVYEESLIGLYEQVCKDVGREDVYFVIGRLSDFDMENKLYPHWTKIREIQERVAASDSKFSIVFTDDLNDGEDREGKSIQNDLHMSGEGYKILGERFANEAILLIENKGK